MEIIFQDHYLIIPVDKASLVLPCAQFIAALKRGKAYRLR
jgi:hypothetical protein